jgi:hypothetical protein
MNRNRIGQQADLSVTDGRSELVGAPRLTEDVGEETAHHFVRYGRAWVALERHDSHLHATFIRIPFYQDSRLAQELLKELEAASVEVGAAYSVKEDRPMRGIVRSFALGRENNGNEIYIVATTSSHAERVVTGFFESRRE